MTDIKPYPLKAIDKDGREYCPGWIWQGHIFKKTPYHKDMLLSPRGWTIETAVFNDLPKMGIDVIQFYDKDERKLYVSSMRNFMENRLPGGCDRHNGHNEVLALGFWRIVLNG